MLENEKRPFIDLRQIQEVAGIISSLLGFFLNFLLLYLILRRTGPKLKSYQKILLQNCIVDTIYNVAVGVTRTETDFKNGYFFVVATSSYGPLSPLTTKILVSAWTAAIFLCVASLPVQFLYRYYFIVKNIIFTGKQYTLLLTVAAIIGIFYGFILFGLMQSSPEILEETSVLLYADPFYYKKDANFIVAYILHWRLISISSCVAVTVNGSYGIVLWTSYKVWKHLKVMESHMSSQTKNIHQQMTKAMIAQALIPFIFNLLPILISTVFLIFFVNVDGLGLAISSIFSWIPVANSLTTIFVVKQYRNFIIRMLKKLICIRFGASTSVSSTKISFVVKPKNVVNSVNC